MSGFCPMDPLATVINEQIVKKHTLPATYPEVLSKLAVVQDALLRCEQTAIRTEHILHGGMYARTIRLEPGTIISGALIKVPTTLIVQGHCEVLVNDGWATLIGYHVFPASAGRKQIFVARSKTMITMLFATQAQTVEEAEREFTDEAELLMSRKSENDVVTITGE